MSRRAAPALLLAASLLAACSGGAVTDNTGGDGSVTDCDGNCAAASSLLQIADVQRILSQAITEAGARGTNATIAVVDRVGNVLGVYRMGTAAMRAVQIASRTDGLGAPLVSGGLEGIALPATAAPVNIDDQAAIAKALTAAYLSTEGNAFTTRTAGQIIQEHFNPGEANQPAGPLFGVQFSQFACSDVVNSGAAAGLQPGPQRSPLGLSADPGGIPLYLGGTVVGGIGVIADGRYGLDTDLTDNDANVDDEAIALAGSFGYAAPANRRADRITLDGKTARFTDVGFAALQSDPAAAPAFVDIAPGTGALIDVTGYGGGAIIAGTAFGQAASGLRADTELVFPGRDAFVAVDGANAPRFPPVAGQALGGDELTANEVRAILQSGLDTANRARAQIRRPLGSRARLSIAVVDHLGNILGAVSTRDPPLFGLDVSVQKARSAALFSSADAATYLGALPAARYLDTSAAVLGAGNSAPGSYVTALRDFVGDASLLGDGQIAWSARAIGLLARPHYPDGVGNLPGPLSKPAGQWSVFADGLQLDVSLNSVLQHLLFVAGAPGVAEVAPGCAGTQLDVSGGGAVSVAHPVLPVMAAGTRLANGLQIFPGGVPIYRDGTLVGAIGVSGDGVDQDDLVAFLGLHEAALTLGNGLGNAPTARRADVLVPQSVRLRYVQCPQAPFLSGDGLSGNGESACEAR